MLLVDDAGRLLLFSAYEQAAQREVWEETGLTDLTLSTEVWRGRARVTGHRWWTAEELATTTDVLRPAGLPQLLAQLLSDGPPDRPITVDG